MRGYLPTTIATASKADFDNRAWRIGALVGRWSYEYIEAGVRAALEADGTKVAITPG